MILLILSTITTNAYNILFKEKAKKTKNTGLPYLKSKISSLKKKLFTRLFGQLAACPREIEHVLWSLSVMCGEVGTRGEKDAYIIDSIFCSS